MATKKQQQQSEPALAFLVGLEEKYPWLKDGEHAGLYADIKAELEKKDFEVAEIRGKLNTWRALPAGKDPRDAKNWDYLCTRYDPMKKTCALHVRPGVKPSPNDCGGNWLICGAQEGKPDAPLEYFKDMGIDGIDTFLADACYEARNYLGGMFLSAMNAGLDDPDNTDDPEYREIEDGDAEEIEDALKALARNVLRLFGFPIADMDAAFKHELEMPETKDDGLDEVIKETAMEERLEANGESEDSVKDDDDEDD